MKRVTEALKAIALKKPSARAFELAGAISTLFKLNGVMLVVTGELAFNSYASSVSKTSELEFAAYAGKLTPRLLQKIMRGELGAQGSVSRWELLGIAVRFQFESAVALKNLCRDIATPYGVVKLRPAEEITAERILGAVFPSKNEMARGEALTLLTQALVDSFQMDWLALQNLCHQPEYRIGEELAQLRSEAKREADARGLVVNQVGHHWSGKTEPVVVQGSLPLDTDPALSS